MVATLPRTVGWHAALKHDMPVLPFVPPEYVGKRLLMLISMWLDDAEDPEGAEMITRLTEIGEPCIDNFVSLEVVLATGEVIEVNAGSHPELFWALRGGGGNFGIVTRFTFRAYDFGPMMRIGVSVYEPEQAAAALRGYASVVPTLPRTVGCTRCSRKTCRPAELADDAIDALVGFWQDMPMEGEVEIIGLGGAIGDVAETDTAFSNRGYLLWLNFAMRWDDPADDTDYIGRTRMIVAALAPWVGRGVYVNMLNFDEQDRVVEALGGPEKHAALARLKAQYDPANLFRMNYNIPPAP